jgi:sodium/hydrogen antiporter
MEGLAALAVVVVIYALVASKLDRWWITGPMVFVAAGAILGPGGLDVLPVSLSNEAVLTITELTLALLLFADASTIKLRDVEGDTGLPNRLLFIGLPLTVVAGTWLAHLMLPGVGWATAALIATILAPTDAALGLAVVTNRAVPVRIRRALNVESGLNDGIATPFVTLFIALAAAEEGIGEQAWGTAALKQIGLAIVAAIVVGYLGGKLLAFATDHGWTSKVSQQIAILALALLAYIGAVSIGGNGFVAAFVAGILFGAATRRRLEASGRFTETLGLSATFLVWSLFGALFVGQLLTHELSAQPILYAILSLTVIRMVPVAIALAGTHLRPATVAFMGWFGPRGLASVVFTLIALEELEHGGSGETLVETATWTILLSVVLHGISAPPLAARYGASIGRAGDTPEKAPAGEPRLRLHERGGDVTASEGSRGNGASTAPPSPEAGSTASSGAPPLGAPQP